jgi:MoCo/4Fe-4S cofactor protein with predicted Tat translocation signal
MMMHENEHHQAIDLAALRERLRDSTGPEYWRSLDELAQTREFGEFLHKEFPREAEVWEGSIDRRSFLKLMGASLALAGLSACSRQQDERIVPYVRAPEELVPGNPMRYATAFPFNGYAMPVLVRSNDGRPTFIEGNPDHPISLGASDALTVGSLLSLYDPDRSQVVTYRGTVSTWERFAVSLEIELNNQRAIHGAGLRILTQTVSSPTAVEQIQAILKEFPQAKWYQYQPVSRDNERSGSLLAFGEDVQTHYRFDRADRILSFDADFLTSGPAHLRYARDFAQRRRVQGTTPDLNRLYMLESTPSGTGVMADHRLPLEQYRIEAFAHAVARELGVPGASADAGVLSEELTHSVRVIVEDLRKHHGRSVVLAGGHMPAGVHALVHAMNHALDNTGATVYYTSPVHQNPADHLGSLRELAREMESGSVYALIILGGNPVYDTPSDVRFAELMEKVPFRVHLGLIEDETSGYCHWHLPESHYLESWSDARAYDGTTTIVQPLINPLYNTRSIHQILDLMMGGQAGAGFELIRNAWEHRHRVVDFDTFWRATLHDGFAANSEVPERTVRLRAGNIPAPSLGGKQPNELEFSIRPDPSIFDGQFANNAWMQELPKPITKLTWDNAAYVSPALAQELTLANEDVVELRFRDQTVRAPIWIVPGQARNTVTLTLGYGRTRAGRVGTGQGFNAYRLRHSDAMWSGVGLSIMKTGDRTALASTQRHHSMEGRAPVRRGTVEEFRKNPNFATEAIPPPLPGRSLYPEFQSDGYAWGMTIDLNSCTGCNACVISCQAENNIPVVGKEEVRRSREMHWVRVDHYYHGDLDNPAMDVQPLGCVHCEKAPCEVVCPVNATVHDHEGLNLMVYNRCVGTRYCSNNCPYKVRRFNFLDYTGREPELYELWRNPDVTVRSRGVMEKCTYCVQRISRARIDAKREDRTLRDGEVVTACQSACPSQAIVFGDLNDPNSRVRAAKQEPRNYGLLAELNTQPRTTYLARLTNPNPKWENIST